MRMGERSFAQQTANENEIHMQVVQVVQGASTRQALGRVYPKHFLKKKLYEMITFHFDYSVIV